MQDSKYEILKSIFEVEDIEKRLLDSKLPIEYSKLLEVMSNASYDLSTELHISSTVVTTLTKTLWPDKPRTNMKVCGYLLHKYGYKFCGHCNLVKELDQFSKNSSHSKGYNTHCKSCYKDTTRSYQRAYQKARRALKINRLPSWADLSKIKEIYKNCPEGYHVDHIIPLQGTNVSGLHVENNLQYLTAQENLQKHNKFISE